MLPTVIPLDACKVFAKILVVNKLPPDITTLPDVYDILLPIVDVHCDTEPDELA